MSDLTRRQVLTGAPAVAAAVVVGVVVAPKAERNKLTIKLSEFASRVVDPAMDRLRAQRVYNYWRSAQTEYTAPVRPWDNDR